MRRSAPLRTTSASLTVIIVYSTTVTFTACSPLVPLPISNIEGHRLSDSLAAQVHEGVRLHQQAPLPGNDAFAHQGLEFEPADIGTAVRRHGVQGVEACVVAGVFIFPAGVPQSGQNPPDGSGGGVSSREHQQTVDRKSVV